MKNYFMYTSFKSVYLGPFYLFFERKNYTIINDNKKKKNRDNAGSRSGLNKRRSMALRRENIYNKVGRTRTGEEKEGHFIILSLKDKRRRCNEPQLN